LRPGSNIKTKRSRLKLPYVMSSSRKWGGRLLQTRGPASAKLLSPNVLCVRVTARSLGGRLCGTVLVSRRRSPLSSPGLHLGPTRQLETEDRSSKQSLLRTVETNETWTLTAKQRAHDRSALLAETRGNAATLRLRHAPDSVRNKGGSGGQTLPKV